MARTREPATHAGSAAPPAAPATPSEPAGAARYAYDGLDRILHEKARLGILTSLMTHQEGLLFNDLKAMCALTDGNLARHIQVLHEAGLVDVWKGVDRRRPQTLYRLTDPGKRRFLEYLAELERVIRDALPAEARARQTGAPGRPRKRREEPLGGLPAGWAPAKA